MLNNETFAGLDMMQVNASMRDQDSSMFMFVFYIINTVQNTIPRQKNTWHTDIPEQQIYEAKVILPSALHSELSMLNSASHAMLQA